MSLLQTASNLGSLWPVLASAAVKSTALLMAAALLSLALRKASAAARHWLWLLALCGAITLPVLSVTLPQWKVLPPQPVRVAPVVFNTSPAISIPSLFSSAPNQPVSDFPSSSVAKSPIELPQTTPSRIDWAACAVVAWAVGAAAMLTPIVLGMAAVFRLGLRSRTIDDPDWLNLLEELCDLLAIASPVRLLQSERRSMPMIWGIWRPRILLPAEATKWSDQRKRLVLLHELAHVKRRDGLTQLIAQFARAVYWFNPFAWLAFRRLEIERERACDDIVLTAGNKPSDYATELMAVATGYRSAAIASLIAAPMARASKLEGRLRAILDIRQNRRHSTRKAICVGLIALLMLLLPLAAIHSRAASPAPAGPQQLGENDPTIIELTQAARADVDSGDYAAALSILNQITTLDPTDPYALGVRQFVEDGAMITNLRKARAAFDASQAPVTVVHATTLQPDFLDTVLPESNFFNVPFDQVIDYLRDTTKANIFVDARTLEAAGVDRSTPITLKLHNVKLSKALEAILSMVGGQTRLAYENDQGVITISTADHFTRVNTQIFDVRDLIEPLPNSKETSEDLLKDLTKLVTQLVAPASWKSNGGKFGMISVVPGNGQLLVTQTPENQRAILDVLDKIREEAQRGEMRAFALIPRTVAAVVHPPADDPWKATLPDGVKVELVGLSENPSKGKPWWKPDGTALADRPFDGPIGEAPPNSQWIERRIVVRLSDSPTKEVGTLWQFDPAPGASASWDGVTWSGLPSDGLCAAMFTAPIEQLGITIRFAVAAGQWRNVAENNRPSDIATDALADGDVAFAPAIQGDNQVAVTVTTAALMGEQLRLVAVDRAGAEHVADGGSGSSYNGDHFSQINSGFEGMKLKDIASIRVEARPYEWVEFKDIALWRGK
ncbi:MAG: M56 family metallopeptidase [Tepidisphaeraceae bacterium]|jgi:beta-lactamase regulating signal transducer with metallopeptidase domain